MLNQNKLNKIILLLKINYNKAVKKRLKILKKIFKIFYHR